MRGELIVLRHHVRVLNNAVALAGTRQHDEFQKAVDFVDQYTDLLNSTPLSPAQASLNFTDGKYTGMEQDPARPWIISSTLKVSLITL